MLPYQLH
jgi:hypothetical protein